MKKVWVFVLLLYGCAETNSTPVSVAFSADSTSIVISNIQQHGFYQLQQDSARLDSLPLIDVVMEPGEDSEGMERAVPGKLRLGRGVLIFSPDTPFTKGRTYVVQTYVNARFASGKDVMKQKLQTRVRPTTVTLVR